MFLSFLFLNEKMNEFEYLHGLVYVYTYVVVASMWTLGSFRRV